MLKHTDFTMIPTMNFLEVEMLNLQKTLFLEEELLNWKLTQYIVTDETKEVSIPIPTEEGLEFLENQNYKKDDLNINQQIENEEENAENVEEVDIPRKTKNGRMIRNSTWLEDYEVKETQKTKSPKPI
ncbi:hypothetical protein QE152_g6134 [Popillia japonica]|uniref:Uncharacterized protein n=1 Tax=Popillia japonica TaxID=7064 RepID=A0AAW1MK79_POPJA